MSATPSISLTQPPPTQRVAAPAWNLRWLTPSRCRMILVALLALGAFTHIQYLHDNCPIDLVGDEAQYWDWSRNLDWSYYSKGPLVAYIIRASCALTGADTMQAVRYPALFFTAGTTLVTFLLTRRLFGSDRLALGAVALNHIVPMFIAGSVLMTIDPPMFFCWALATYFAARAIFDEQRWAWVFVGLAIGIGFLAKYAAMLWFVGLFGFLFVDLPSRKYLRGARLALIIACVMTLPVIIWNARHGWVSFRHVARQTGASGGGLSRGNLLEFLGSQFGVIGPVLSVMMVCAIAYAIRKRPIRAPAQPEEKLAAGLTPYEPMTSLYEDPHRRQFLFLVWIGVTFFGLTTLISLFTKVQVNWPAPAYFTLMILTAYWLGTRLKSRATWRPWRVWFWGTVALGLITIPIAHDSSRLFPVVKTINAICGTKINPASADLLLRLRGWRMLGDHVSAQLNEVGPGAFVLCDDYMQTAEMAFYVAGQPKTYYAGSYYTDAKRFTQYDLWPDRRLDDPKLRGRNAIYVGKGGALPPDIVKAFERIEPLPPLPVVVRGVELKTFKTWRGYGFKGMTRGGGPGDY